MILLRNHFADERNNAKKTGGGPSSVNKNEMTGAMLELCPYYGHLMSGLPSYDCDRETSDLGRSNEVNSESLDASQTSFANDLEEIVPEIVSPAVVSDQQEDSQSSSM